MTENTQRESKQECLHQRFQNEMPGVNIAKVMFQNLHVRHSLQWTKPVTIYLVRQIF